MAKRRTKGFGSDSTSPVERRAYDSPGEDPEIRLRFHNTDDDRWALHKISRVEFRALLKRIAYFESLTVAQAKQQNVLADYDMADCPNRSAKARLANQYDGLDSLARLKVSKGKRIFGIRQGGDITVIWWDPKHEVWPEGKVKR